MEWDGSDLRIRAMVETYERAVQAMRKGRTAAAIDGFRSLVPQAKRISSLDAMCVASAALHQVSRLTDGAMKAADTAAAETMLAGLAPGSEPTWMLQFALAGHAAHENDPAAAMALYDQANAAKRATMYYQADTVDQFFDALIRCFDVGMIDQLSRTGDQDAKPVFIVGMPRSGTTLSEQIIASIPGVHGAGKLSAVANLAREVYEHEGAWPGGAKALTSERATALSTQYMETVAKLAPDEARIEDKMPMNFQNLGLILAVFQNAKILHIEREAADTCFSCYRQLFTGDVSFSYYQQELGRYHTNYVRLMQHWRMAAPGRIHDVSYRGLIENFEDEARAMVDAIEMPWSDAALAFHKTERENATASAHQVRQPLFRSGLNTAKAYKPYLAPLMDALTGSPAASPQAAYQPAA
jgi:hypothetical protein